MTTCGAGRRGLLLIGPHAGSVGGVAAIKNNDPSIYVAAGIPAPQPPAPVGPPEQPTELDADVILPFGV